MATTYTLAQDFLRLIRAREAGALEPWMATAGGSGVPEFGRCAARLRRDGPAVEAALRFPCSNGQTEGQINI